MQALLFLTIFTPFVAMHRSTRKYVTYVIVMIALTVIFDGYKKTKVGYMPYH